VQGRSSTSQAHIQRGGANRRTWRIFGLILTALRTISEFKHVRLSKQTSCRFNLNDKSDFAIGSVMRSFTSVFATDEGGYAGW
jgi:hypothetical protein